MAALEGSAPVHREVREIAGCWQGCGSVMGKPVSIIDWEAGSMRADVFCGVTATRRRFAIPAAAPISPGTRERLTMRTA